MKRKLERSIFPGPVRLFLVALLGLATAIFAAGCDGNFCMFGCEGGQVATGPSTLPTASPTPPGATPTPTASPTPDPCRVESLVVGWSGGGAPQTLGVLDAPKRLDATAFNAGGEIPDGCNVTRRPEWSALPVTTCAVIGSGWNPSLDGLGVGSCTVKACLRQSGDAACFLPEYRPDEKAPVHSDRFVVEIR